MLPYTTNDVVNNCENNGNTPLHIALKNNQLDIVNFLLSNFQCNFNIKNLEGEFPMHLVLQYNPQYGQNGDGKEYISEACILTAKPNKITLHCT